MKIALLADIHGNAPALQSVLQEAEAQGAEAFWFLGDILGYGPLPVTCINLLDRLGHDRLPVWLMGNHDLASLLLWQAAAEEAPGVSSLIPVPSDEWRVILWHVEQLKVGLPQERLQKLKKVPTWTLAAPGVYAAHGAIRSRDPGDAKNISSSGSSYIQPGSPALDETLDTLLNLTQESGASRPWLVVVGHTHRPALCRAGWEKPRQPAWQEGPELPVNNGPVSLADSNGQVTIFCPGSAGFPRSLRGDPRAAYAVLDLDNRLVWFRRVDYNVREAWAAMVQPPRALLGGVDNWVEAVQINRAVKNGFKEDEV